MITPSQVIYFSNIPHWFVFFCVFTAKFSSPQPRSFSYTCHKHTCLRCTTLKHLLYTFKIYLIKIAAPDTH